MNKLYLTYKIFNDKETAEDFAEILKQNSIDYFIEEDALVFDPSYANNPLNKDYAIKIMQDDFEKASGAYKEYFQNQLDHVPSDYYLFSFNDEELLEILEKPDEWGSFDYELAQKILGQRGVNVSQQQKETLKTGRYKELAKPEVESIGNIFLYYVISILLFPVGFIVGWIWAYSKKVLPNGQRIFAYNESVRKHGRIIFAVAIILCLLTVTLKVIAPHS